MSKAKKKAPEPVSKTDRDRFLRKLDRRIEREERSSKAVVTITVEQK